MPDKYNPAWRALRQVVIARAGGVCERCRARQGHHVHHLIYGGRKRGEEPPEWLQLLCLQCHQALHPRHKLLSSKMQKLIAAQRARRRRWTEKQQQHGCHHCGGTYPRAKHRAICVKFGLARAATP